MQDKELISRYGVLLVPRTRVKQVPGTVSTEQVVAAARKVIATHKDVLDKLKDR